MAAEEDAGADNEAEEGERAEERTDYYAGDLASGEAGVGGGGPGGAG